MSSSRWRHAARLACLAVSLEACASLGGPGNRAASPVQLRVVNHNDATFDVYALASNGSPARVGMVAGFRTGTFALSRDLTAMGTVRIIVVPIGGFGAASSGSLVVRDGDTIEFTVAQVLSWSSATVQPPGT